MTLLKPANPCLPFQRDLSCLVDGELDGGAVKRVLIHLEVCGDCSSFFGEVRNAVRLHRDLCEPGQLLDRFMLPSGERVYSEMAANETFRRLAGIFYELGKAYLLLGSDPKFVTEVFHEPVQVVAAKNQGRGYVDAIIEKGEQSLVEQDYDWIEARHLLNGALADVEDNLTRGRVLIEEALILRPNFAEARLYLGWYHQLRGGLKRAASEYRRVFRTAGHLTNRVHAAIQLGQLHTTAGDYPRAAGCYRWAISAGALRLDRKFFFLIYNLAVAYARMGEWKLAQTCFQRLVGDYPDRMESVRGYLRGAQGFQRLLRRESSFRDVLEDECPDLFPVV